MKAVVVTLLNKAGFRDLDEQHIQIGFRQYKYEYTFKQELNTLKFTLEGNTLTMNRNNTQERIIKDITQYTLQELNSSIRLFIFGNETMADILSGEDF